MAGQNVARRIEIVGVSTGVKELEQDLRAVDQAQGNLAKSSEAVAKVTETTSRRQISAAGAYEKLRGQIDQTYRSEQKLSQGQAVLDRAFAQGIISAQQYGRDIDQLQKKFTSADGVIGRFSGTIMRVVAPLAALLGTAQLINYADTWSDLSARVGLATGDMDSASVVMERLADTADKTYSSVTQTVESFIANSTALKELGLSTKQQLDYTEALNLAMVVSGAKGDQAARVQDALSKAMALGALKGNELNTIIASGGEVATLLAGKLGIAESGLREAGKAGKITADIIKDTLIESLSDLQAKAEEMPTTIGDGFLLIGNAIQRVIGTWDQLGGISETVALGFVAVANAIKAIPAGIDLVINNLDSLTELAGVAALGMAMAFGPAIVGSAGALAMTIGRNLVGAVYALNGAIAANPIGALATAFLTVVTAAYVFRDEIKQLLGVDVLGIVTDAANMVINSFRAAFEDVSFVWNNFGAIMGAAVIGGVNAAISALNFLINKAAEGMDWLIEKMNKIPGVDIGRVGGGGDFLKEMVNKDAEQVEFALEAHNKRVQDIMNSNPLGELGKAVQSSFKSGEQAINDANAKLNETGTAADVASTGLKKAGGAAKDLSKDAKDAAKSLDDLIRRADGLAEKMFPAEYARREAMELTALLDKVGGALDEFQRKAVEAEIENLFKAASQGLRKLPEEASKAGRESASALEDSLGSVLNDLFSQPFEDMDQFFDELMSNFARIGQANIDGLFGNLFGTGKGAGAAGAANDNDPMGFAKMLGKEIGKTSAPVIGQAAAQGNMLGLENVLGGKGGAMLNAALGGFGMGYQTQDPMMGGLGGAISGFGAGMSAVTAGLAVGMAFPIIGAVIGGIAGIIGGIMGKNKAKKDAALELDKHRGAIENLLMIGEGGALGDLQKSFNEYADQAKEGMVAADRGGDRPLFLRLQKSVQMLVIRMERDFNLAFEGMIEAFDSGHGSNSPFIQAQTSVTKLRDELKGFVADVEFMHEQSRSNARINTVEDSERLDRELERARLAAQNMALAMLSGAKELSHMESEVLRAEGAAAALQVTLEELQMSADRAAEAISGALGVALGKLQAQYLDSMNGSINDLSGLGYLNDLADAQKRYQDRVRDAAALGLDGSLAMQELSLSLREIVTDAKLTEAQIDMLSKAFPHLAEMLGSLMPGMSGSSLADAQSAVDRAKADLRAAYDKEARALEQTISRHERFITSIQKFKDDLLLDQSLSPLNPFDRFQEAQKQFNETAALAITGDEEAMGRLEEVSRAYLDEAKSYYATSETYFRIFEDVRSVLDQALDSSKLQLSDAKLQLQTLKDQVSKLIDIDDGVLSVADAIAALHAATDNHAAVQLAHDQALNDALAAQLAAMAAANSAAISAAYQNSLGRVPEQAGADYWQGQINQGVSLDSVVNQIGNSSEAKVQAMYREILGRSGSSSEISWWLGTGKSLDRIREEITGLKLNGAMALGGIVGAYNQGGMVGNGLFNIDSVIARYAGGGNIALAGGEHVTRATSVTAQTRPFLDHVNQTGRLPSNDNGSAALVAEIKALRGEVAALRAENNQGHSQTAQAAKGTTRAVDNQSDKIRQTAGARKIA